MTKRTMDFSDYTEPTYDDYTGEDPPANRWFTGTVKSAKYIEDGDQMMFVIEVSDPDSPFKGWGRGYYGDFEGTTKWKFQEILRALQGGKTAAVSIDWENPTIVANWLKKQKTTIKFQTREYNDKITIGKVRPLLEVAGGAKAPAKVAPAPVVEEPVVQDDATEELEDYTEEELGEMEVSELEAILKDEFSSELPTKPRRDPKGEKYADLLIDAILAEQESGDDEDKEPEGDAEEGDTAGDDADEFDDGFDDDADGDDTDDEPEPEPAPAPARRSRATKAAPAAAPATTRRRRS